MEVSRRVDVTDCGGRGVPRLRASGDEAEDGRGLGLVRPGRHGLPPQDRNLMAQHSGQLAFAEAVLAEVRRKPLPEPDIDFAVATLARVAGMVPGAGEAVFAVARAAGWIVDALRPTQAAVRYVPPLPAPARLRSSAHDAVAVCYRFVT
jgi:citrate synthase